MREYYTYILRCCDGTFYTGWTSDLEKRIHTHNTGKGSRYTRGRLPVVLVHSETFPSRSAAMQRECAIKKMNRLQKEILLNTAIKISV